MPGYLTGCMAIATSGDHEAQLTGLELANVAPYS